MERVAYAITGDSDGPINWKNEARAAILEVARWLREQGWVINADLLEQEAGR
jgi:membrane-bound lytic murein transglycosylase B